MASINEPAPRDIQSEGIQSANAQTAVSPFVFSAEQALRPNYAQLDLSILNNVLTGEPVRKGYTIADAMQEHPDVAAAYRSLPSTDGRSFEEWFADHADRYPNDPQVKNITAKLSSLQGDDQSYLDILQKVTPELQQIQTDAERRQTEADISRVEDYAPRANEAFRSANPELTRVRDELIGRTTGSGLTAIQTELERQAMAELQRGGALSADEERAAINSARNAFAARGMAQSNPSAVAEVLARDAYSRQRLNDARQFAGTVDTAGFQQRATNINQLGQVASMEAGLSIDPFMSILGRPVRATGAAEGVTAGAGGFASAGPQIINPFNAYASQLNSQNFSAANANAQANASMTNDLIGGAIGGAAMVGTGGMSAFAGRKG